MRLLVLNSNTSDFVTQTVAAAARDLAAPGTEVTFATGAFGAKVIESRSELAIAHHATMEAVARHAPGCDGILIAVSYDVGVRAARELTGLPVLGITEAAFAAAMTCATRVGLVLVGRRVATVYREVIDSYGWGGRLAGVRAIESSAPYAAVDQTAADRMLVDAACDLVVRDDAEAVVLAGAVMAGRSSRLEAEVPVPLLDGVRCGIPALEALVRMNLKRATSGSYSAVRDRTTVGLADPLSRMLASAAAS
ncbi:MAG: aspartate/glutamate racemase family protein [Acetobacteraceae bacterium]